ADEARGSDRRDSHDRSRRVASLAVCHQARDRGDGTTARGRRSRSRRARGADEAGVRGAHVDRARPLESRDCVGARCRGVDGEDAREADPAEAPPARPGAGRDRRVRVGPRGSATVTAGQPAVEVRDLEKRYPRSPVNAVDGVSFTVERGEVFGLLGPNGAGKTTTVGILTTCVRPTGGSAFVGGVDVVRDPVGARAQVAVVPQRSNLDREISIRDNLIFHAAYHGVPAKLRGPRADELLDQFGLLDRANSKPDYFSGGQSQRVMIARALMHQPIVLFLDEPTTGLDPAARLFVWDRLRELRAAGVTL